MSCSLWQHRVRAGIHKDGNTRPHRNDGFTARGCEGMRQKGRWRVEWRRERALVRRREEAWWGSGWGDKRSQQEIKLMVCRKWKRNGGDGTTEVEIKVIVTERWVIQWSTAASLSRSVSHISLSSICLFWREKNWDDWQQITPPRDITKYVIPFGICSRYCF